MNKKVKKFFKRNKPREDTRSGVDICTVNVVVEAEKIIEEYVGKMGYRFGENKKGRRLSAIFIAATIFICLASFAVAARLFLI